MLACFLLQQDSLFQNDNVKIEARMTDHFCFLKRSRARKMVVDCAFQRTGTDNGSASFVISFRCAQRANSHTVFRRSRRSCVA
jgi:hypothetical protein